MASRAGGGGRRAAVGRGPRAPAALAGAGEGHTPNTSQAHTGVLGKCLGSVWILPGHAA